MLNDMNMGAVGLAVKRLQVQHHRAMNAALADMDVTIVQWDALRHLDENPGASLHDLAVLTFQTDQAFGTLAKRLEERGLIERVEGVGRAIRPRLTPKGLDVRRRGAEKANEVLAESFAPLSATQLAQFEALLGMLVR